MPWRHSGELDMLLSIADLDNRANPRRADFGDSAEPGDGTLLSLIEPYLLLCRMQPPLDGAIARRYAVGAFTLTCDASSTNVAIAAWSRSPLPSPISDPSTCCTNEVMGKNTPFASAVCRALRKSLR